MDFSQSKAPCGDESTIFYTFKGLDTSDGVTHRATPDPRTGLGGVLGVVEHQHVRGGGLGGDDARVLGHVARPVHLALMVNLDLNLYLSTHRAEASKFCVCVWGGG